MALTMPDRGDVSALSALMVLSVSVVSGTIVLALWLDPVRNDLDKRSAMLGVTHAIVASLSVLAWVVFVVVTGRQIALAAVAGLGAAALLGIATLVSSLAGERRHRASSRGPEPLPAAALFVHGTAGLAALVLALVTLAS